MIFDVNLPVCELNLTIYVLGILHCSLEGHGEDWGAFCEAAVISLYLDGDKRL